jgi:isohexenylglutaconyl-CoA hydratase
MNRSNGAFLLRIRRLPATVIAAIEGAAIGGGFGLACVTDIALATAGAKFAMSETTLGVTPAQISPFVALRIGVSQALRLALSGERIDGHEALRIGLVHRVCQDAQALEQAIVETVARVLDCAPGANRVTKELFLATAEVPLVQHLDYSAGRFAQCLRGAEGGEGVRAFLEKRPPSWARPGKP